VHVCCRVHFCVGRPMAGHCTCANLTKSFCRSASVKCIDTNVCSTNKRFLVWRTSCSWRGGWYCTGEVDCAGPISSAAAACKQTGTAHDTSNEGRLVLFVYWGYRSLLTQHCWTYWSRSWPCVYHHHITRWLIILLVCAVNCELRAAALVLV